MKKIFVLFLAILIMAVFSVPVFAADKWSTFENATGVKLSKNVTAHYYSSSGASYSATTYNSKGTKTYGAASDSTWIYSHAGTGTDPTTTSGDSNDFSGWASGTGA